VSSKRYESPVTRVDDTFNAIVALVMTVGAVTTECNCVSVSYLVENHDVGEPTVLGEFRYRALPRAGFVLNVAQDRDAQLLGERPLEMY